MTIPPSSSRRKNQRSVVMISLEDYQALEETAYLLRSPKNARRLMEAIAELEAGGGDGIGELADVPSSAVCPCGAPQPG